MEGYAVIPLRMHEKSELIVVPCLSMFFRITQITKPCVALLILHGSFLGASAQWPLVRSPVHTGLLDRFCGHCSRRRCPSLLLLVTYFIEVCKSLSRPVNWVFFSLLFYHAVTDKSALHTAAGLTSQQGFEFISQITSCWKTDFSSFV